MYPRPHRAPRPRSRGTTMAGDSLPSHSHTCAASPCCTAHWSRGGQRESKQTLTYTPFLKTFWRLPSPSPTDPGLRRPLPHHLMLLPTHSGACPPSPGYAPLGPGSRPLSLETSPCSLRESPSLKPQRKRRLRSPAMRGCFCPTAESTPLRPAALFYFPHGPSARELSYAPVCFHAPRPSSPTRT